MAFVGECGDTDFEGLLGGIHKTVMIKGLGTSSLKLHANRNYPLEDIMPFDSFNVIEAEKCDTNCIRTSLGKLGILEG